MMSTQVPVTFPPVHPVVRPTLLTVSPRTANGCSLKILKLGSEGATSSVPCTGSKASGFAIRPSWNGTSPAYSPRDASDQRHGPGARTTGSSSTLTQSRVIVVEGSSTWDQIGRAHV